MARFVFKLQTVFDHRKRLEQVALRHFGEAQLELQKEMEKKSRILADLEQSLQRREQLLKGEAGLQGSQLLQIEDVFILGQKQRIYFVDQAIFRRKKALERVTRFYLLARKNLKVMETLQEKALQEHRVFEKRKEMKEIEDLQVMRTGLLKRAEESEL